MGPKQRARQIMDNKKRNTLQVVSACSGMCTESFALKKLQVPHRLVMAREKNEHMRRFILRNHCPEHLLEDVTAPEFQAKVGDADVIVAGFPCQPFSEAGLLQGEGDSKGRGNIVEYLINWIKTKLPKSFMLENARGLIRHHPETFQKIMGALRAIKVEGRPAYTVVWEELNSKDFGVPQDRMSIVSLSSFPSRRRLPRPLQPASPRPSAWRPAPSLSAHFPSRENRPRIYIVGQLASKASSTFVFPKPKPAVKLSDLLDKFPRPQPDNLPRQVHQKKMVMKARERLQRKGFDPREVCSAVDARGSNVNVMVETSPCITAARGVSGGHWLVKHGRHMSEREMFKVQGMDPETICTDGLRRSDVGRAIGNAMTQTVLEALFRELLPTIGFPVKP